MFDAIIWGLVQGLTEFLPISSSGHLALVPALLSETGLEIDDPSLPVSVVLHLGTLLAVLVFYRSDLSSLLRFRQDPNARRVINLLALGTIPVVVGLPLRTQISEFESDPTKVAAALIVTGLILAASTRAPYGRIRLEDATVTDALLVGIAQAFALLPGISRSGSTITMGLFRGLDRTEAARYSFLLAIPTIAGAGVLSLSDLSDTTSDVGPIAVGFIVSALSGYAAITWLIRILATRSFMPFSLYCLALGTLALIVL